MSDDLPNTRFYGRWLDCETKAATWQRLAKRSAFEARQSLDVNHRDLAKVLQGEAAQYALNARSQLAEALVAGETYFADVYVDDYEYHRAVANAKAEVRARG